MKVSELIGYARSLANIASTASIGHDDEDKTINPSWKDIYGRLIDRDDDYFTSEKTFSSLTTYATTNPNEYKIPLPSDFYRLRFVDYQPALGVTGTWTQMHKMPLSMRNDQPSEPHYRFDSTNLWIVGTNVTQVRVHYYPPPATLTHPDTDLAYGTSYAPGGASGFQLITSPAYAVTGRTMAYIYNLQNIVTESLNSNTVVAPVTIYSPGANMTNLVYYKGYMYWLQAGNIIRAPTDLVTNPLVPTTIINTTTVTSFAVFLNKIYYTDNGSMKSATLTGGSATLLLASTGTWLSLCQGIVFYIDGSANLKSITTPAQTIASGIASACVSDGTNLYVLDTSLQLHQYAITVTGGLPALTTDTILRTDVQTIGPWAGSDVAPGLPSPDQRIPAILSEAQQLLAVSAYADSSITYPANIVTEIMGVKAARDFCIKLGKDWASLKEILGVTPEESPKNAATGLWATFYKLFRRDDYEPERIKNSRMQNSGMGML